MSMNKSGEYRVDLNSDLGESFGAYKIGMDKDVLSFVSSANIACGFHAGDPAVMAKTVALAAERGVSMGAHPGYPDLVGFGRRNLNMSEGDLHDCVLYQLGALSAFVKASGAELVHVKPHGAMYNMAAKDIKLARAICRAVSEFDNRLILLGLANSRFEQAAEEAGIRFASEVFADRGYMDDGSLVPRSQPGAMITDEDEAVKRVVKMIKQGTVTSVSGSEIPVRADSVCVHGDGEKALAFTQKIRAELEREGISVVSLGQIMN